MGRISEAFTGKAQEMLREQECNPFQKGILAEHAIPTEYNGIEFRSKAEAHYAVFFDYCKAYYVYEPEGYRIYRGYNSKQGRIGYLPDFLIYCKVNGVPEKLFVEVKPYFSKRNLMMDALKIEYLSELGEEVKILVVDAVPRSYGFKTAIEKSVETTKFYKEPLRYWSFWYIDGSGSIAYMGCDRNGELAIVNKAYFNLLDIARTEEGYYKARNTSFWAPKNGATKAEAVERPKAQTAKAKAVEQSRTQMAKPKKRKPTTKQSSKAKVEQPQKQTAIYNVTPELIQSFKGLYNWVVPIEGRTPMTVMEIAADVARTLNIAQTKNHWEHVIVSTILQVLQVRQEVTTCRTENGKITYLMPPRLLQERDNK